MVYTGPLCQGATYRQGGGECLPVARETGVRQQNLSRRLAKARSRRVRSRWEMTQRGQDGIGRVFNRGKRPNSMQSMIPVALCSTSRVLIPLNAPVLRICLCLAFEEFVAYRIPGRW